MGKRNKEISGKQIKKQKVVEEPIEEEEKEFDDADVEMENESIKGNEDDSKPRSNKKTRMQILESNIEAMKVNDMNTGVIYIGHLPWGFEEKGIKKYFEQFGPISRIMVPRSVKTGRLKGYAFVEFEDREVAEVAAKSMNNYVLFDKILKCSVIDDTSRYGLIFKKWKRKFNFTNKYQNFLSERNRSKTSEEVKEKVKLLLEKEEQKRKKLEELGIQFNFPGFKAIIDRHLAKFENQNKEKKTSTAKNASIEKSKEKSKQRKKK